MRLNKSSGSAGKRTSVVFKMACHSSTGDRGRIRGVGALVTRSRSPYGPRRSGRRPLPGGGALWRSHESRGYSDAEHLFPTRPGTRSLAVQGPVDHQPGHFFHHMLEIEFRDAGALEIRRGIQKVDGVGHPAFDGELDGVHFVAQRLVDRLRIFHHARAELRRQVLMVDQVFAFLGIIVDGDDVRFAESEASHVLIEINEFLKGHAVRRSLVVRAKEFLLVVHFVAVLPGATRYRPQDGVPPSFTISAVTPSLAPSFLTRSIKAGGKLYSRPQRRPTVFMFVLLSGTASLSIAVNSPHVLRKCAAR